MATDTMTDCCRYSDSPDHFPGPCAYCPEAEDRQRERDEIARTLNVHTFANARFLKERGYPEMCDHCRSDIRSKRWPLAFQLTPTTPKEA